MYRLIKRILLTIILLICIAVFTNPVEAVNHPITTKDDKSYFLMNSEIKTNVNSVTDEQIEASDALDTFSTLLIMIGMLVILLVISNQLRKKKR